MSQRETILAAVATKLAGLAGGRVYRTRREQIGTLPAVVITPASETMQEFALGLLDHSLEVSIDVYASGDTPDSAADAVIEDSWAALAADPTLGLGSNVQLRFIRDIQWDFEDFDMARASLRITIEYRT